MTSSRIPTASSGQYGRPKAAGARITLAFSQRCRPLLEAGDVVARVEDCLAGMLTELELPLSPSIELDAAAELPARADLQVTIAGERTNVWELSSVDDDSLVYAISALLLRCRSSLIDEEAALRIWIDWYPTRELYGDRSAFVSAFRALCELLVARGIKPSRAKEHLLKWQPEDFTLAAVRGVVEKVLRETDSVGIELRVSEEQHARLNLAAANAKRSFTEMARVMADELFDELGLVYKMADPAIDGTLRAPWFRIRWNDITSPPVKGLSANEVLVNDTADRLTLLNLKGRTTYNPANGNEAAIVPASEQELCESAGLTVWDADKYAVLHASSVIRRNAGSFVSGNLWAVYEATLGESFPNLLLEATARFEREDLTRILRLLLDEEISIRDLRSIVESLLSVDDVTTVDLNELIVFGPNTGIQCPVKAGRTLADLGPADYCDCVRMALRRYVSHKLAVGGTTVVVYLLDEKTEQRLRAEAALTEDERRTLLDAIGAELLRLPQRMMLPSILTTFDIRRPLRQLLAREFPSMAVVCYQELAPDMNIQPMARIQVNL